MKVEGEEEVSYAPAGGTPAVVEIAGGSAEPQKQETKGTNAKCRYAASVADLIADAKKNPAVPIVDKLLNRGDRLLIHGYEETYKSSFAIELGRCIAMGEPFLGELRVPTPICTGIVETEMLNPGLGERLQRMFSRPEEITDLKFLSPAGRQALIKQSTATERIKLVEEMLVESACEVGILDVATDLFGSDLDPDKEKDIDKFFERLAQFEDVKTSVLIRHDSKPKEGNDGNSNNRIRGSSRWKELPDTILYLKRTPNSEIVEVQVGKLRYGRKPKHFKIRFDLKAHTIVPANPVLFLLRAGELSREQLLRECEERYELKESSTDKYIGTARDYLDERTLDRQKVFSRKPGLHPGFIWCFGGGDDEEG